MSIMDKKFNENRIFKLFHEKKMGNTENIKFKVTIDIFYKLFRLDLSSNRNEVKTTHIDLISDHDKMFSSLSQ